MPRAVFATVLSQVEEAKEQLVAAVPSPRGIASRSLAEALIAFEEKLRSADQALSSWPASDRESVRSMCSAAVAESLARAEKARLEAPALDYEALVYLIDDLLAPLEAFLEAELLVGPD